MFYVLPKMADHWVLRGCKSVNELACDRRHCSAFQTLSPDPGGDIALRLINVPFPTL